MSTEQRGRDTTDTIDTIPETEPTESYSSNVPELTRGERREVARRTRLSAIVVHETVREEGERELQRHPGALAWSALAAGLSMGFSLVTRLHIIIIITYLVALGGFAHIIAGSVDVLYLVNVGTISWLTYLAGFLLPTLIGNIIGGVSLVAALNFAQVASERPGT
jgi:formate/nitrite transporter FocA (FNT family)